MMMTRRNLLLEPGEIIRYNLGSEFGSKFGSESRSETVFLQAVAPQDCDICVLAKLGGCRLFACVPSERHDGHGVHFVKIGKEEKA